MDKRKKFYVVLDTETTPTCPTSKVEPSAMFVYDLGFAIVNSKGEVFETRSFVIRDIFNDESDLMQSAYYASKLPQYRNDIANGTRKVVSFYEARKELARLMSEYNTHIVIAHNARFDYGTLNNTQRWLTKSKYRYFFPYGTIIWDTMKMAQDTLCKQKRYIKYCKENGYTTSKGVPRKTAEVLYKYITKNNDFTESHTALEDVLIEKTIFAKCNATHKKMRRELWDTSK